jgi:peroxiredoxin
MKKFLFIASLIVVIFTKATSAQIPSKPEDISPILIGETLPTGTLLTPDGKTVNVQDIIIKPTVMIFYRGGWCPYCNTQLGEMAKIESEIIALGYDIIAISPDDYMNLQSTTERNKDVKYSLYADKNGSYIRSLGIAFTMNQKTTDYIKTTNKGIISEVLPVPTVLIVSKEKIVEMEYINPNITKRLSGKMLLAVLKSLQ